MEGIPEKKAQTFLLAKFKLSVIMVLGLLLKRQNPGHGIRISMFWVLPFLLKYKLYDILHNMNIWPRYNAER